MTAQLHLGPDTCNTGLIRTLRQTLAKSTLSLCTANMSAFHEFGSVKPCEGGRLVVEDLSSGRIAMTCLHSVHFNGTELYT